MITNKCVFFITIFLFTVVQGDIGQLPYCQENVVPGLVLVSTIDGKFSAVSSEGALLWQFETDPGPLLTSNIHNLELTNSGKWIRIIPSLTGSLYRFDGLSVDPIPISAESLLKSSFKYSDELVIAGGLDVRTYGVGFRTGKLFYTCSSLKCTNTTNNEQEVDDILLVERTTQTVRAIESQSGHERWNFSVGHHNIKLPQVTCTDPNANLFNWNLTTIIPDGLILASRFEENVKTTWQYQFPSPIVKVWKWNGHEIAEVDLFAIKLENEVNEMQVSPAIYVGMHKKQLYIHESDTFQHITQPGTGVVETLSLTKIPWKPISANGLLSEDDSTALSVLYSSEYVNGHGYFLFSEFDMKKKNSGLCKNNITFKLPQLTDGSGKLSMNSILMWWKEVIVILITTSVVFKVLFKSFARHHQQNQNVISVERQPEILPVRRSSSKTTSESSDGPFNSRYMNDFDTLACLGKGGFGVVFEVKQKIDECHYAIKRIVLPDEETKRETVMREVKALAKLEHRNIVRYFNSWVEKPPHGWQEQHDCSWINQANGFESESLLSSNATFNKCESEINTMLSTSSFTRNDFNYNKTVSDDESFIEFRDSGNSGANMDKTGESGLLSESSRKSDVVQFEDSQYSASVNWRKPQRCYHSFYDTTLKNPPVFLYIQMQLCQRHSLKEWLIENKDRNFEDVLGIFKQIVSAVEYVHMQGLIHRDLKPSNIFFSLDGQIKVGDFGLVKDVEESFDTPQSRSPLHGHTKEVGTRLYMSPEQLRGEKYNYKVDIYSLGMIFFELLMHFSTDMERIKTLSDLRQDKYPLSFDEKYPDEYKLLRLMLREMPDKRLTTFGIRARPPISSCDSSHDETFDFDLPKAVRAPGLTNFKN